MKNNITLISRPASGWVRGSCLLQPRRAPSCTGQSANFQSLPVTQTWALRSQSKPCFSPSLPCRLLFPPLPPFLSRFIIHPLIPLGNGMEPRLQEGGKWHCKLPPPKTPSHQEWLRNNSSKHNHYTQHTATQEPSHNITSNSSEHTT